MRLKLHNDAGYGKELSIIFRELGVPIGVFTVMPNEQLGSLNRNEDTLEQSLGSGENISTLGSPFYLY